MPANIEGLGAADFSMTDDELRRVFAAFDTDSSGKIDYPELLQFIKALRRTLPAPRSAFASSTG